MLYILPSYAKLLLCFGNIYVIFWTRGKAVETEQIKRKYFTIEDGRGIVPSLSYHWNIWGLHLQIFLRHRGIARMVPRSLTDEGLTSVISRTETS